MFIFLETFHEELRFHKQGQRVADLSVTSWTSSFLLFSREEWTNMAVSQGAQAGSNKHKNNKTRLKGGHF